MGKNVATEVNTEEKCIVYDYTVIAEALYSEDIGDYISYGISVHTEGREVERISDISDEQELVKGLAELCNREGLDVIHFRDVVEDFLNMSR